MSEGSIRLAEPGEGKRLRAIELAAAQLFTEIGMDDVAEAGAASAQTYERFIAGAQAMVATLGGDVAGFLTFEPRDAATFVCELCVDPRYAGRRLGARLLEALPHPVTLSCFVDVPWNRPYYERLGFQVVSPDSLGVHYRAVAADEKRRFAPWRRCVMLRDAL
ncbi:MAG: GNAT family N-acetyltransferase [Pseudomonadota bacterium]